MRYTYQNNTFIPLSNTISIIVSCCFSSRALKNIKVTKNLEFVQQIACSNLPINLSSLVVASIPRQRGVWVCCVCHQRLSTPATTPATETSRTLLCTPNYELCSYDKTKFIFKFDVYLALLLVTKHNSNVSNKLQISYIYVTRCIF